MGWFAAIWDDTQRGVIVEKIQRRINSNESTNEQLDLQALIRMRDRLVSRRTSLVNQIRAFLLERGITFRQGRAYLRQRMPLILEDAELNLSPLMRQLLDQLWQEWKAVEEQ